VPQAVSGSAFQWACGAPRLIAWNCLALVQLVKSRHLTLDILELLCYNYGLIEDNLLLHNCSKNIRRFPQNPSCAVQ
jgi:hypothetical protein